MKESQKQAAILGNTAVPFGFEAAHREWLKLEARISVKHKYRHGVQPEFYETKYWKLVREAVLLRDGRRCSRCGDAAVQVHHLSYHHRGEDHFYPECLVAICLPCHGVISEDKAEQKKLLDKVAGSIPNLVHLLVNERTSVAAEKLEPTSIRGEPLGQCPICGASVFETGLDYACEKLAGNKKLCTFRIGKLIKWCRIEPAQVTNLLTSGKTELLNGFVSSETSHYFKAFLTLKNSKVELEVPMREKKFTPRKLKKEKEIPGQHLLGF